MTDRLAQARAEAEREALEAGTPYLNKAAARAWFGDGVERGVVWADANPKPRTITRGQMRDVQVHNGLSGRDPRVVGVLCDLGIEVEDDDPGIPDTCAACGQPAEGFAMINDQRFCHPDDGPSCYMGGRT